MRSSLLLAVMWSVGCQPQPIQWDLDRPSDRAEDLVRALFLIPGVDQRDELSGPHAVGATVRVRARRKGPFDLDNWSFDVSPAGAATVRVEEQGGERAVLSVRFEEEGEISLQARNGLGGVRDRVVFDVREIRSAVLQAYADIKAVQAGEAADEGALQIVEGGSSSILVTWRDADGEVLTGRDLASFELDAEDSLVRLSRSTYDQDNLEGFTITAGRLPTAPPDLPEDTDAGQDTDAGDDTDAMDTDPMDPSPQPEEEGPAIRRALAVKAGDRPVGVWTLRVVPVAVIQTLDIGYHVDEEAEEAARDREATDPDAAARATIGWARVRARDGRGRRVLSPPTLWQDDGESVDGRGALVNLVLGGPSDIDACVRGTEVCGRAVMPADLGQARRGVSLCGCASGAAGGGVFASLAVGLLAYRRRRGVVAAR